MTWRLTIALFLLASAACRAEPAPSGGLQATLHQDPAEVATGLWTATRRGGGACQLALGRTLAGRAYPVQVERCDIDALRAARAWRPAPGGFELLDGDGRVVERFESRGVDAFETDGGSLRLERAALR